MIFGTRKISKEIYDRAKERNGYITRDDMKEVFSVPEIYGYEIYSTQVYEDGVEYFCKYNMGESCD